VGQGVKWRCWILRGSENEKPGMARTDAQVAFDLPLIQANTFCDGAVGYEFTRIVLFILALLPELGKVVHMCEWSGTTRPSTNAQNNRGDNHIIPFDDNETR
jgi:hypothetical protein